MGFSKDEVIGGLLMMFAPLMGFGFAAWVLRCVGF